MKKLRAVTGSLRFQLIAPVTVIIFAIVFLITLVAGHLYSQTFIDREAEKTMTAFEVINTSLSDGIEAAQDAGLEFMMQNSSIHDYLSNSFPRLVNRVLIRIRLRQDLTEFLTQQRGMSGIVIVREDGSLFGMIEDRSLYYDQPSIDIQPLKAFVGNGNGIGYTLFDSLLEQNAWQDQMPCPEKTIVIIRKISVITTSDPVYAMIIYNLDMLGDYLSMRADEESSAFLIMPENTVVLRYGERETLDPAEWSAFLQQFPSTADSTFAQSLQKNSFLCAYRNTATGWYLVRDISTSAYEAALRQMRRTVWSIAGLILLLSLGTYLIWARLIARDFDVLRQAMKRTGIGHLDEKIYPHFRISEFDEVRHDFNQMNRSLNQLITEKERAERERAETELRNLQMQLSPHMIFNSITAIRWMAIINGDKKTAAMLVELAAMLQPVFREWTMTWTLQEEMMQLDHYAKLLDLRFGNHFKLDCHIPDDLLNVSIPRFTLQPLIENACEHGNVPQDGCLRVTICATEENGVIVMTVSNNGESLSEGQMKEIRALLTGNTLKNKVGLRNVYEGLKMCLGAGSDMTVSNHPEGGVTVRMTWPIDHIAE